VAGVVTKKPCSSFPLVMPFLHVISIFILASYGYKMAAVVPVIASLYKEGSGHISYSLIWKENLFQKCLWHDPHVVWKMVT